MSLNLADLVVPPGLDLAIVVRQGPVIELHLQGLHEGKVQRHEQINFDKDSARNCSDLTPVVQAAIDKMSGRMMLAKLGPLRLS